ncbi:alpha/beta hydrolase family protein [Kitasatospora sp. NPDC048407]|uniref:alpha/beta hydrolase family protein n=1 Tax=Kitasatospora sp. NPDC048407 TaxID=3364051 RepID=UPI00371DA7EF
MIRIRRTAAAAALLLAMPLPVVAAAPAPAAPAADVHVELPRPTGEFAVGRQILHLTDQSRTDPWVPSTGPRQLMVSMYYPAKPGIGGPAPYMTPEAARLLLDGRLHGTTIPTEVVTDARTWSRSDALPRHGRHPLVVLSPGFTMPRSELTALAEDLTSHGYVVALVDHTYENTGTTFPDGHTTTCVACEIPLTDAVREAIENGRAKDVSFVIDQLTTHPRYAHLIDRTRIGMAGHSAGGAAAVPALLSDDRIRAGVDLDGSMDVPVPATGLKGKPFLMVGRANAAGDDSTWTNTWAHLDGWKRWLTVTGASHMTFTDNPLFFEELGIPQPPGTTMTAARGIQLTRQYVAAFFDLHLKGIPQPALDGPATAAPEVTFHP